MIHMLAGTCFKISCVLVHVSICEFEKFDTIKGHNFEEKTSNLYLETFQYKEKVESFINLET